MENEEKNTETAAENTASAAPNESAASKDKRTKVGVVVSNKMQKTVVVAVENLVKHGMYQKYIKRTNKFLAHNENPAVNIGDRVVIEESRPLSKRKRWNVREVLAKTS
jgi:small subunit ribosomal protein S17